MLLKFKVTWSASRMHWSVVLWRARKPNWLGFCMCLWIILRMTFSNSLPAVGRRLIGLRFWRNFGFLPGFGKVITFASFQDDGRCDRRKQWLNRWVRWTNGFRGSCLRHSLGMSSIPRAFINLSLFFVHHRASLSPEDRCSRPQTRPGCGPLPAVRDVPHTGRVMRIIFPVQSAITITFCSRRNLSPVGLWMADGAFVLSPLFRDFTRDQLHEEWSQHCLASFPISL
jgi:hypothetical protein